jgi:tellurite resistance protein TerC
MSPGISTRAARRVAVCVGGGTLLLLGAALLVLPGPGLLVLALGLSLLATEFVWARIWLRRLKVGSRRTGRRLFGRRSRHGTAKGG